MHSPQRETLQSEVPFLVEQNKRLGAAHLMQSPLLTRKPSIVGCIDEEVTILFVLILLGAFLLGAFFCPRRLLLLPFAEGISSSGVSAFGSSTA
jgi:hypothetical protein